MITTFRVRPDNAMPPSSAKFSSCNSNLKMDTGEEINVLMKDLMTEEDSSVKASPQKGGGGGQKHLGNNFNNLDESGQIVLDKSFYGEMKREQSPEKLRNKLQAIHAAPDKTVQLYESRAKHTSFDFQSQENDGERLDTQKLDEALDNMGL